jgi:lipoprotein-anchoring transpeptidase ErfK/SrfK
MIGSWLRIIAKEGEMAEPARGAIAAVLGLIGALHSEPAGAGTVITYQSGYPPGAIVISQGARALYLILDSRTAIAYRVAVAKRGKEWSGPARVQAKFVEPAWSPPDLVKRDHPELPDVIAGGSPHNPMGARAITLDRDEIAIHGTTQAMRASVGSAASYGCIRMLNEDVIDLFDRVAVGAPVMMGP